MSGVDDDSSDCEYNDECSIVSVSSRGNMSPSDQSLQTHDYRYCGGSLVSAPIMGDVADEIIIPGSELLNQISDDVEYDTPILTETVTKHSVESNEIFDERDDSPIEMPRAKKQNKNCLVSKHHSHSDEICWLCTFATHPKALQISTFIVNNISNIDIHNMSSQIKDQILQLFPRALGVRKRDIIRHICDHMLSPNVRMAATIRSLMALADTVKTTMHQRESETGELVIDLKGLSL
jgi:hypothetical protein